MVFLLCFFISLFLQPRFHFYTLSRLSLSLHSNFSIIPFSLCLFFRMISPFLSYTRSYTNTHSLFSFLNMFGEKIVYREWEEKTVPSIRKRSENRRAIPYMYFKGSSRKYCSISVCICVQSWAWEVFTLLCATCS